MSQNSFTYKISAEQNLELKKLLEQSGFEFSPLNYGHFSARKAKCVVNSYQSGKLVLQGKDAKEFIEFQLEPLILKEARLGYEAELNPEIFAPHFGIDESGKGDFFGPLVIAGVYVDEPIGRKLLETGVKDSKRIQSDQRVIGLAKEIKKILPGKWDVIAIGPERYNELYLKFGNLNKFLGWGHIKIIENLAKKVPDCPRALSDQFAHPTLLKKELAKKRVNIQLDQRTKAESDIAVAAASILARAEFVQRLQNLGKPLGIELPKGASALVKERAAEIVQKHGVSALDTAAKKHFKTYHEVILK